MITKASDDMGDLSIWDLEVFKKNADNSYTSVNSTVSTWLTVYQYSDSSYSFRVYNTPVPATGTKDVYRVRVYVTDDMQNDPKERYIDIALTIKENIRPIIKNGLAYNPFNTIRIIESFYYVIDSNSFEDTEGDKVIFTYKQAHKPASAPADALDWISITVDTDTQAITLQGETPRDNDYVGDYIFDVELTDP